MGKFAFLLLLFLLRQCLLVVGENGELDTSDLTREGFPKGFTWGVAASAYQVEGMASKEGRGPSWWDSFIAQDPGRIAANGTAEVADDEYNRYKEDVDLMAELNFDSHRFSISWSRIFPDGEGRINWLGVAYYNRLIDYLLEKGITPYANLHHYDLPDALQNKYNGWLSTKTVKAYVKYADFCFKTYGDRVKNWFTFNEPKCMAAQGYDSGINPPARCSPAFGKCAAGNSAIEPYIVGHNLLLAHGGAVHAYRTKYQKKQQGRIGILVDFHWYEPLDPNSMDDIFAAQRARDFHVGWFLHPITYGIYPDNMVTIVGNRLPKFTEKEIKLVKGSVDYIGINHYTTYYMYDAHPMKTNVTGYQNDWNVGFAYDRKGVPIGPRANSEWLYVVPWGIYKIVTYVKEKYNNPTILLSENGMDDPGNVTLAEGLNDSLRLYYYKSYLSQLKKAIDEGANVIGYHAWSLLDNFEWLSGYTSRFGMVYIDRNDNLKRYPKNSAKWFKKFLG